MQEATIITEPRTKETRNKNQETTQTKNKECKKQQHAQNLEPNR